MKPLKKPLLKFFESRARWNSKIQSNAINDEDVSLIVNTSILGELCAVFLNPKKPTHFQSLEVAELLETEPNLFFEYICLEKKYQPNLYKETHADLVTTYQSLLKDMYKGKPTIEMFSLISLISLLHKKQVPITTEDTIIFTSDLIENQPKEAIEAILEIIFFQTNFGLKNTIKLDKKSISALEIIMLEATKEYDFLFVTRILRTLTYVNAKTSDATKKAVRFLRNYKPRKMNVELEVITPRGLEKLDVDAQMIKLNKEIVLAMLEWKTDFRFYRDFGKSKKGSK